MTETKVILVTGGTGLVGQAVKYRTGESLLLYGRVVLQMSGTTTTHDLARAVAMGVC